MAINGPDLKVNGRKVRVKLIPLLVAVSKVVRKIAKAAEDGHFSAAEVQDIGLTIGMEVAQVCDEHIVVEGDAPTMRG